GAVTVTVSRSRASAVAVSGSPPTPRLSVAVWPTARVMVRDVVCPPAVTSMRYVPGGRPPTLYAPEALVCTVRLRPVARLVAVTRASLDGAESADTRPCRVADVDCASTAGDATS